MANEVGTLATAVEHEPHSFDHIRRTTALKLTDEQFIAMVGKNRGRFTLVSFVHRDSSGHIIHTGRPGVKRRADFI